MFKSLRDRLKGVSKKIEEGLDFELEQEIEAELQASLRRGTEAPSPEPEARQETAEPEEAPSDHGTADEAPPEAGTEEAPVPVERPSSEAEGPGRPEDEEEPAGPPSSSAPETAPSEARQAAVEASEARPAPPTEPRQATEAPQKPVRFGRKVLSEEEIEARLRRELEAAVDTQREVEEVVRSSGIVARYTINEDVLEEILWELEVALLESDVALPVIEAIKDGVKEQLLSMTVGGRDPHEVVEKVLRSSVRRVLNVNPLDFDAFVRERLAAGKRPVVVMFVGVNGTGKTTSIGRIAWRLKEQGVSCVMAAGDTFRAGAIEQLALHGERLGVRVIKHSAGADPAAVAYDAIEHAKARHKDVVLLDTAGRMQTNTNLMDEMDKIRRVAKPDLVVFVGDSLAGNDAVEQARRFDEVVDIDGAILTKVDVDAKGGAALSVAYTINKPLLFVGVGQDYPDLRPFDPQWMVDRLFGAEGDEHEVAASP